MMNRQAPDSQNAVPGQMAGPGEQAGVFPTDAARPLFSRRPDAGQPEENSPENSSPKKSLLKTSLPEKASQEKPSQDARGSRGFGFLRRKWELAPLRPSILTLMDDLHLPFDAANGHQLLHQIMDHVQAERGHLYTEEVADALLEMLVSRCLSGGLRARRLEEILNAAVPPSKGPISFTQIVRMCALLISIMDAKSTFTLRHSRGVAEKTEQLAGAFHLSPEHVDKLVVAALLHDIGKLTIPGAILDKNGPLTDAEYRLIRGHARMSGKILSRLPGFKEISVWASHHHERLDGSGYPYGCTARYLTFDARVLACADVYQALVEERPYHPCMPHARAMIILNDLAEHHKLDADIVHHLDALFGKTGS